MLCANFLSVTHLLHHAFLALEVLSLNVIGILGLHSLSTVLHATEIWFLALGALVKCACMQGELGQFSIIEIAFSYDSSFLVQAFFDRCFCAKFHDFFLELKLCAKGIAQNGNFIVEEYF